MGAKLITSFGREDYNTALGAVAEALRAGELVIFPTETVYGLGAAATHGEATRRLRELKGLNAAQGLTVHIAEPRDVLRFVPGIGALGRRLARRAWPGALTLAFEDVSPADAAVASEVDADALARIYVGNCVQLRCPDHEIARELIRRTPAPLLASSANRPSQPPPVNVSAALSNVGDVAAYAVDGGESRLRAASTIVSIRGNAWGIRRPGILDDRTIRRLVRSEILMVCTGNTCRSPMAAYLFRKHLAERLGLEYDQLEQAGYGVRSAGTSAIRGGQIAAGSREELANRGVDASDHRTQPLTLELIQQAERIYCMSPEHRLAVIDFAAGAAGKTELLDPDGTIEDPIGSGPEAYASAAAQIERAVVRRVEEFVHDDRDW